MLQLNKEPRYFLVQDKTMLNTIFSEVGYKYFNNIKVDKEYKKYFINEYISKENYIIDDNIKNSFKRTINTKMLKEKLDSTNELLNMYFNTKKYIGLVNNKLKYHISINTLDKLSEEEISKLKKDIYLYLSNIETKELNEVLNEDYENNKNININNIEKNKYLKVLKYKNKIKRIILRVNNLRELEENIKYDYIKELLKEKVHVRIQVEDIGTFYNLNDELINSLKEIKIVSKLIEKEYIENEHKYSNFFKNKNLKKTGLEEIIKIVLVIKFMFKSFVYETFYDYIENYTYTDINEELVNYYEETQRITRINKGLALCASYSAIIAEILNNLGIKAVCIEGNMVENNGLHQWNKIKINNRWYNLDYTMIENCILDKVEVESFLESDEKIEKYAISQKKYARKYSSRKDYDYNIIKQVIKVINIKNKFKISELNEYTINKKEYLEKQELLKKRYDMKGFKGAYLNLYYQK